MGTVTSYLTPRSRGVQWTDQTGTALVRPDGSLTPPEGAYPSRALVLGDSYGSNAMSVQATAIDYGYRSEITYANVEMGWIWDVVANASIAGETTAQIAARTPAAIATYEPAWVLIPGGAAINSINSGLSAASVQSSLATIFDACRGRRVVWCTSPTNAMYLATAAKREVWARVNRWALAQCRARGFCGVDTSSTITDPATGLEIADRLYDGLHPNMIGASQMARAIVRAVRQVYGVQPSPLIATGQWAGGNLVYNPFASGSNAGGTGGFTAGGLTGNGPSGWEGATHGTGSGVTSKVAPTDEVPCDWARLAVTVGATKNAGVGWIWRLTTGTAWASTTAYQLGTRRVPTIGNGYIYRAITAGTSGVSQPTWPTTQGDTVADGSVVWQCFAMPTGGDKMVAAVEFRMDSWSAGAYPSMYIECLDGGSASVMQGSVLMQRATDNPPNYVIPSGVMVTPEITLPATTASVNLRIRCAGAAGSTGNFDIRRVWCALTNR